MSLTLLDGIGRFRGALGLLGSLSTLATGVCSGSAALPESQSNFTNGLNMELVWLPNTVFRMGSSSSEFDCAGGEGPIAQVRISEESWMGKFEVTRGEWAALMTNDPPITAAESRLPVANVTWSEAMEFCRRLTEKELRSGSLPPGHIYRLPTEAEWERACRAGTTSRFSFADDLKYSELGKYAWYSENSSNQVHEVGLKLPNPWGLYDMHGNVSEWCLDCPMVYSGGKLADPMGTNTAGPRACRGGACNSPGRMLRSASRDSAAAEERRPGLGFRVALASRITLFSNEREQLAYAIGVIFGIGLRMEKFDLDPAMVAEAMAHAYKDTNSLRMPGPRARAFLDVYKEVEHDRRQKELADRAKTGAKSTN